MMIRKKGANSVCDNDNLVVIRDRLFMKIKKKNRIGKIEAVAGDRGYRLLLNG